MTGRTAGDGVGGVEVWREVGQNLQGHILESRNASKNTVLYCLPQSKNVKGIQ